MSLNTELGRNVYNLLLMVLQPGPSTALVICSFEEKKGKIFIVYICRML